MHLHGRKIAFLKGLQHGLVRRSAESLDQVGRAAGKGVEGEHWFDLQVPGGGAQGGLAPAVESDMPQNRGQQLLAQGFGRHGA